MKKLLVFSMVLVSFVSYGQVRQVVNKTTSSTNPVKLTYEKDEFTGKEYLMTETDLLVSDDGKKGFKLYPRFKKENGKWNSCIFGVCEGYE
jgi:hypothetical protein